MTEQKLTDLGRQILQNANSELGIGMRTHPERLRFLSDYAELESCSNKLVELGFLARNPGGRLTLTDKGRNIISTRV